LGADVSCVEAHAIRTTRQRVEFEWISADCGTHAAKTRLKLIRVI